MQVSKERMIELVKNAPECDTKATHARNHFSGYYYYIVIGNSIALFNKDGSTEVLNEDLDYYSRYLVELDYSVLEDKPVYTQEMCDEKMVDIIAENVKLKSVIKILIGD